jgi:hypothetical protein
MKTDFRKAWERRLEDGAADDVVVDLLEHALGALAGDELDIVGQVVARLRLGRERYGQLAVGSDTRDLGAELLDEAFDGLVYAAGLMLQLQRRRSRPLSVVQP